MICLDEKTNSDKSIGAEKKYILCRHFFHRTTGSAGLEEATEKKMWQRSCFSVLKLLDGWKREVTPPDHCVEEKAWKIYVSRLYLLCCTKGYAQLGEVRERKARHICSVALLDLLNWRSKREKTIN